MKKIFIGCMLLLGMTVLSQQKEKKLPTCASDAMFDSGVAKNPAAKDILNELDMNLNLKIASNHFSKTSSTPIVTIPVVFYIVYDPANPASNISDPQVDSQLTALNTYFSDYGIKFCKATKAGTQTINSITRFSNAALANHDSATEQASLINLIGNSNITADRFLRIWIVNTIDGPTSAIQGYGTLAPFISSVFDGIVMKYNGFGNENDPTCACSLLSGKNTGKILVHEVGHYLGLFHTFYQSCAGMNSSTCSLEGDKVCDTPPVNAPNYSCIANADSCGENPNYPDKINNYMDYGDDNCANQFTPGQVERMFFMLNSYRSNLSSYDNMIYTATCDSANLISANFNASAYTVCSNNGNVDFSINSGANTQYLWNFGDSTTSTTQNPSHTYSSTTGSPYTVTLTVTNTVTQQTAIKTEKIFVTNCVAIQNEDSYWYTSRSCGIKFNTGIPIYDPTFPYTNVTENGSTVQSSGGSLLFYANRGKIYNSSHTPINTTDLAVFGPFSQSVLSLPKPGSSTDYYVFTNSMGETGPTYIEDGLRYNIVRVIGGVASLISTRVPVTQPTGLGFHTSADGAIGGGAGITAVKHCNGYWIITQFVNSLVVYNLTSSGLTYVSNTPLPVYGTLWVWNIEVSPSGNKIFAHQSSSNTNCLFDFNKAEGLFTLVYTAISGGAAGDNVSGASFSPDSKLLYTIERISGKINQYNLNSSNIEATKIIVGNAPLGKYLGEMQRGPDNKLYIGMGMVQNEMAVIHNPNTLVDLSNNVSCNYSNHGPKKDFSPVNLESRVLPNIIDAKYDTAYPATSTSISYYLKGCRTYKFFPDFCGTSFRWDFGDGSGTITENDPTHTFASAGTYTVILKNSSNVQIASINIVVPGMTTPTILGSSTVCPSGNGIRTTNNSVVLQAGQTAFWSITTGIGTISGPRNQPDVNINWNTPGTISLTVTDISGCSITATKVIIEESAQTPTISTDNFCFSTPDYSTSHTVTVPAGYTAQWTFENSILGGNFSTASNLATVGVNWDPGTTFGYLGVTLTNPGGCTFYGHKTVYDQCVCDCFNTRTYTYTKSNLTITIAAGNSNPACAGAPGSTTRYSYGDGTFGNSAIHTYAAAGSYTVTITGQIKGAFDETVCSGNPITLPVSVNCKYCLERQGLNANLTIYPNPASSMLNIDVSYNSAAPLEVVLKSVDGKELLRKKWMMTKGKNDLQMEIPNNISDGMIFVELISDEISETRTVLIKK